MLGNDLLFVHYRSTLSDVLKPVFERSAAPELSVAPAEADSSETAPPSVPVVVLKPHLGDHDSKGFTATCMAVVDSNSFKRGVAAPRVGDTVPSVFPAKWPAIQDVHTACVVFVPPPRRQHVCAILPGVEWPPRTLSAVEDDPSGRVPRLMRDMSVVDLARGGTNGGSGGRAGGSYGNNRGGYSGGGGGGYGVGGGYGGGGYGGGGGRAGPGLMAAPPAAPPAYGLAPQQMQALRALNSMAPGAPAPGGYQPLAYGGGGGGYGAPPPPFGGMPYGAPYGGPPPGGRYGAPPPAPYGMPGGYAPPPQPGAGGYWAPPPGYGGGGGARGGGGGGRRY